MKAFRAATMTELYNGMAKSLIYGTSDTLDMITNLDSQVHNVIAQADSMVWDCDLRDMWITKSRWNTMVRQYLDPIALEAWIDRTSSKIGKRGRGISVLRSLEVAPRGGVETGHTNRASRRWGSCMLSWSFKALPRPQITMVSRTSYVGYIAALDFTVAWNLGRYIAQAIGIRPEDIQFVWMNEAVQWHYFKSIGYMLHHPDVEQQELFRRILVLPEDELTDEEYFLTQDHPNIKGARSWLIKLLRDDDLGNHYGLTTYNTYRRVRRRYHTEVIGYEYAQQFEGWDSPKRGGTPRHHGAFKPLPHVMASTLDFSGIRMPFGKPYGEPFAGEEESDDDDE